MAHFRPKDRVDETLCQLFPSDWLEAQAREQGVICRARKLNPVALFWTLVLSFGIGRTRDIATLRRASASVTGVGLSAAALYERCSGSLVAFLQRACAHGLSALVVKGAPRRGLVASFHDLLITDASVIRLHDQLARTYQACRTNHTQAAAKLHLVLSVFGRSDQRVQLSGERLHDRRALRIGPWVRDRLLLFDLGYFSYALFARIADQGGFFLSRLKEGCNPLIVGGYQKHLRPLLGHPLQDVLPRLRRPLLDLEVEVPYQSRPYRGRRRTMRRRFRLVGVRHPLTHLHHLYLTNLHPTVVSPAAIGPLYRARWLVELAFQQLKSFYQLERFRSRNEHVVHALIYSALLTLVASRHLECLLRQRLQDAHLREGRQTGAEVPWLRLAAVLTAFSGPLLQAVLQQAGAARRGADLTTLILAEAVDPNHSRPTLYQTIERYVDAA
ncbi:MAG: IS4 family transposase [Candidatus Latescibacterota bacterium]